MIRNRKVEPVDFIDIRKIVMEVPSFIDIRKK